MVSRNRARLACLLIGVVLSTARAEDNEPPPDMALLEFLGEGRNVDGEYNDPLQMQGWVREDVVDAGQQQKGKDDE